MSKLVYSGRNLCYSLLALTVFWAVPALSQEPGAAPKPAEEVYKNIQVFKGMPAPQVMEAMHSFTHSLGVKCDYCHVEGNRASDDKPEKQTARKMVLMARGINKDNFNGERRVTCWTCHRGSTEPESKPEAAPAPPQK